MANTDKLGFEIETCSRCGGCGKYSYNQINGSVCFGCGGKGIRHTKRGGSAYAGYIDSLKVELGSLKVGDLMQVNGLTMGGGSYTYFARVVEIGAATAKHKVGDEWVSVGICVTTENAKYGKSGLQASADMMVRKGWSEAEKAPKIAAALAYQASLTKAGTVAKRA